MRLPRGLSEVRLRVREMVEWSASVPAAPAPGNSGRSANRLRTTRSPARVEALEIAEQQQAKAPTGRESGPAHHLGVERGARAFDERIELRLVEHAIQASVERMGRAARQILRGHPHGRLARSPFSFAHRHAQSLGPRDRRCRSVFTYLRHGLLAGPRPQPQTSLGCSFLL